MSAETTPPGKANNGQRTPAPEMPENSFMAKEKRPAKKPVSFPLLGRVDSRATHLKQPLGCFKRAGPERAFSSHPPAAQTKTPCRSTAGGVLVGAGGFEPPKQLCNRFTVCPHWPLGNTPTCFRAQSSAYLFYQGDRKKASVFLIFFFIFSARCIGATAFKKSSHLGLYSVV